MKKLFQILVCALLLFTQSQNATSIYLTPKEWASFVQQEDWAGLIDEHFLPELFVDDDETIMFAQELNISNGFVERWGERYMFGKLESAYNLRQAPRAFSEEEIAHVQQEVGRLLLGPWLSPGETAFRELKSKPSRVPALIDGEWRNISTRNMTIIHIRHKTDVYGSTRVSYLGVIDTGIMGEILPDLARYDVYLVRKPSI